MVNLLPKLKEEKQPIRHKEKMVVKKEPKELPATIVKEQVKPLSDVEKLQQQLSDIEGQLSKL